MSTITNITDDLPDDPTIPLTPEVRDAYQDLYDQYEDSIEATHDPGVHQALMASQLNVQNVLDKDDLYRIAATTALFEALLVQINDTNQELEDLQKQILAISNGITTFADILAAITKVLSLVPAP